ncbi:MAG: BrnA antitoxin family protein [Mesorhizobium sp.]
MSIRYAPASEKPAPRTSAKPSRKGIGGRPKKADALVAVTLRLHPDVVSKFKASGKDWRAQMAKALSLLL